MENNQSTDSHFSGGGGGFYSSEGNGALDKDERGRGVKGSYKEGRVEYHGMGVRGGSVDDDGRSVLGDEYRVISS